MAIIQKYNRFRRNILIFASTSLLVSCNLGAPSHIIASNETAPQIAVSATATTSQAPDTASVSAGVVTQSETAGGAMAANSAKMNTVFEALQEAGILAKNIQTSQLSLSPRYNYKDRRAPKIEGYEARNTVSAKTENLEGVGPMLDALVSAGVNNINGVKFSIKEPDAAKAEARTQAIKDAREKAQAMAKAAGVRLGKLKSISENSRGGYIPQPQFARAASFAADAAPTPVAAGEQTLSVTVNLTYEILQ